MSVYAPDDIVAAKRTPGVGPAALTLYTMRSTGNGSGAHSSLLVNASERVMFDPAGSFSHPTIPERNDLLIGVTPQVEDYYVSYHARETFYVLGQTKQVPPAVAEQALALVRQAGPVGQANCTRVTSSVMRQLPGFQSLPQTWFPNSLADAFGQLPGVTEQVYRENDSDDKSLAAKEIDMQIRAAQGN